MPEEDFHLSDRAPSRAHERGRPARSCSNTAPDLRIALTGDSLSEDAEQSRRDACAPSEEAEETAAETLAETRTELPGRCTSTASPNFCPGSEVVAAEPLASGQQPGKGRTRLLEDERRPRV